jgi:hypothetical protein
MEFSDPKVPILLNLLLSATTLATIQSSHGFHEKSETKFVCPPCRNTKFGGPSSVSFGFCSKPIL